MNPKDAILMEKMASALKTCTWKYWVYGWTKKYFQEYNETLVNEALQEWEQRKQEL